MASEDDDKEEVEVWRPQAEFVIHAVAEVLVCAVGIVCNVIQMYFDLHGLFARQAAANAGALAEYDSTTNSACWLYLIPTTILAQQPAGVAAGPFWRIAGVVALSFVSISAAPMRFFLNGTTWNDGFAPFGKEQGCWYEGAIMVLVGASFIGSPTNVIGPALYQGLRYGTGWALIGMGSLTVAIGVLFGAAVRWMRGQIPRPPPPDSRSPRQIVWDELDALHKDLEHVYIIRFPLGEVEKYEEDLTDALALLEG